MLDPHPSSGSSTPLPVQIPNDPRLVGLRIYQQWYFFVFVYSVPIMMFWIVSDGGEMTIGL